jgi:2-oxoglutarate ferredoxin oxidoreductase subunit delta
MWGRLPTCRPIVNRPSRAKLAFLATRVQAHTPMAKGSVYITIERCKGCGFCVEFCPTRVLSLSSAFNSKGYHPPHVVAAEKCSGCDLCGLYCPDFAIYGARHAS